MNSPVVIATNHKEWFIFCELCAANNTTPDKIILDYITNVNKQATAQAAQQSNPISLATAAQPEQPVYHSPSEDMNTMDELGAYLQELNKERIKEEKKVPPDLKNIDRLKNEIRIVTKKMVELS